MKLLPPVRLARTASSGIPKANPTQATNKTAGFYDMTTVLAHASLQNSNAGLLTDFLGLEGDGSDNEEPNSGLVGGC